MKLKHWQGYGTVNAKKLELSAAGPNRKLVIEVTGNHEYGLTRDDAYDVYNWLVKRFAKDCPNYRNILSLRVESDDSGNVERATYEIIYQPEPT